MLEVREREAPAPTLIVPKSMRENGCQVRCRIIALLAFDVAVGKPLKKAIFVPRGKAESQGECATNGGIRQAFESAAVSAASVAPRRSEMKTKSLKWPACSAASCRLSLKSQNLLAQLRLLVVRVLHPAQHRVDEDGRGGAASLGCEASKSVDVAA